MTRHATTRTPGRLGGWLLAGLVLVLVTAGAVALAATGSFAPAERGEASADPGPTVSATPTATPTPTPPPDAVLTLVAAGDVLLHEPVMYSARDTDGSYDFAGLLEPIEPWVAQADLALCHLEVPVTPDGVAPSGYPMFGAPAQVAEGLAENGWDGCSTASNHSMDRGWDGVVTTLDALDDAGLGHVGTARSEAEADSPQVYELVREGQTIRVAQIAATYGTNGLPVPEDRPWAVTLIDTEALVEQATRARQDGADIVVASVHCCVEYVTEPTDEQHEIAAELAESGVVDLVIGHHAHVPLPIEKLDGGPRGEGMWVAHGLGNMISNQDADCCTARTDSGLLMTATFRKPVDGPASVTGVEWTAVTVDRHAGHLVHPLPTALADGATPGLGASELAARQERVEQALGNQAPERTSPPEAGGPAPDVVPRAAREG